MNYKKLLILIGSLLFLTYSAVCQNTRDTKEKKESSASSKPGSFTVRRSFKKSAIDKDFEKRMKENQKSSKKGIFGREHDPHAEFAKRMKKVGKENLKEERIMRKPQYSDPTYFGHKRKPKIRPVGKKKVCKECGLKH